MSYQHSKSFEVLKSINESIEGNLTSLQYLQTLDMFLWRAIEPIHSECPALMNNYFCKIVARQTLKAATKFSSDDRSKLPITLFNMLSEPNPQKAHEHAKSMHLNRGVLFGLVSLFLNKLKYYEKLNSPFLEMEDVQRRSLMHQIETDVGLRNGGSLYAAYQQANFWDYKARDFKGKIIQKYTRMALLQAKTTYEDYNHYVPLDDVVQIYLEVLSKAINRCDSRQGVLTTFIMNWFKSARSEVDERAKSQTDQSYEALTEEYGDAISEIIGFSSQDNTSELEEHISFVARKMDRQGYIRAVLRIPEWLPKKFRDTLERYAVN